MKDTELEHNHDDGLEQTQGDVEFDAAGKSLSEALRLSFVILKIIMIVLVVLFLASGFRTVDTSEQALVLRFGKIRGIAEERLLGPGLHWILPYPIDEMVKIPVARKINLPVESFWYYETLRDKLPETSISKTRVPKTLNPLRDGYCITRGEQKSEAGFAEGRDYNIVHAKWQLSYGITDPERFFRNVYTDDVKPGQIYFDVIAQSITPLLKTLVEDAVVTAMVNYSIDEALLSKERIPKNVQKLLQEKLDHINSGITAYSVQLTDIIWPRQVHAAFLASIRASQESQRRISEAKGYAENTLNEAAGPVAEDLLNSLKDENTAKEQLDMLWAQAAGLAQEKIAQARAYRTEVVESAKANARYLEQLLPEYRKRPKLVLQKIYQDAVEYILDNVDEKMVILPSTTAKGKEIRIMLNRDPTLKPKSQEKPSEDQKTEEGH